MTASRLPDAERAVVPERKVVRYLLNATHPDGRGKARFFTGYGFAVSEWTVLAAALRRHAAQNSVVGIVETAFGVRYIVEGTLDTPDGRKPTVRVVWFIVRQGEAPVLVTAYPMERR